MASPPDGKDLVRPLDEKNPVHRQIIHWADDALSGFERTFVDLVQHAVDLHTEWRGVTS